MNKILVVLSSVTVTRRIQKQLEKYGIFSQVIHTPFGLVDKGCSSSLRIGVNYLNDVNKIIYDNDIPVLGYYNEIPNGSGYKYVKR